jgi:hypothetical protein
MNELTLTTYFRSGSNFVTHYLTETTDIKIIKTHRKILNNKNIFTIVRDPLDSISSMITMENSNGYEVFQDKERYELRIKDYEDFYIYLLENVEFIINFNSIENKIEEISNLLCKKFGGNKTNQINENNKFEWFKKTAKFKDGSISTSKNNIDYNFLRESLKDYDLSKCYQLYNNAISKSII